MTTERRNQEACEPTHFKMGMRRLASGISIITSARGNVCAGLVATAVSSVSTDPPTLLICVNQSASAHTVIDEAGVFAVNILSSDNVGLVDIFGTTSRRNERFQSEGWHAGRTGAPLLKSALVSFDCRIVQRLAYNSHTIFLGVVADVCLADRQIDPLLYMDSSIRRLESAA